MTCSNTTLIPPDIQALLDLGLFLFPIYEPTGYEACRCGNENCANIGKHPRVDSWQTEATDRPRKINRWLTRYPDTNIGIACGPSRLVVIDEDADGEFARFCADHNHTVTETLRVRTADGQHLYYRAPSDVELGNSEGALRSYTINVRGSGGYVVGPGSVHESLVIYSVVNPGVEIAPLPRWIVELLPTQEATLSAEEVAGLDLLPSGTWSAYGRMAALSEIERVANSRNGSRNTTLNTAAFRLGQLAADRHIAIDVIERRLSEAGLGCGLEELEVVKTITSGIRGGLRQPRSEKAG